MERLGVPVAVAATLLLACTAPTSPVEDGAQPPSEAAQVTLADVTAGELRLALEGELGHHGTLMIAALRAEALPRLWEQSPAPDLAASTGRLADILAVVTEQPDEVRRAWSRFSRSVLRHAEGDLANGPLARRRAALVEVLTEHTGDLTDDELDDLLQVQTEMLARYHEALSTQDYATAYTVGREYHAEVFAFAKTLAAAFIRTTPGRFEGASNAGAIEVRSAVTQLLAEHTDLLVHVVRRGATGADDFEQAAAALNGNTEDLTTAIDRLLTDVDTAAFDRLWRQRISHVVDYTVGVAERNTRLRRRARSRLDTSTEELSAWIADVSDGDVTAERAAAALTRNARLVRRQIDAYDAGKERQANRVGNRAYRHSASLAEIIGDAITDPRPEEFPSE